MTAAPQDITVLSLDVPDISCGHCKASIEGAVAALDGVASVDVTIDARTVDVRFAAPATRDAVVAAIESVGYRVAS